METLFARKGLPARVGKAGAARGEAEDGWPGAEPAWQVVSGACAPERIDVNVATGVMPAASDQ
jgi:hypothetical protein